jgi:hypothetical protein
MATSHPPVDEEASSSPPATDNPQPSTVQLDCEAGTDQPATKKCLLPITPLLWAELISNQQSSGEQGCDGTGWQSRC